MAKTIGHFCSPENLQNDLKVFFKSLLVTCVLRNGDAHMKNFTLLHQRQHNQDEPRVWLSPAYDICTTNAYLAQDMLALTLAGSKRHPTLNKVRSFGLNSCFLTKDIIGSAIDDVTRGVQGAAVEMMAYCENHPEFHHMVGANMLRCWEAGLQGVNRSLDIHPLWLEVDSLARKKTFEVEQ